MMLVEINLLPKKAPKNLSTYAIIGILLGFLLVGSLVFFLQYIHLVKEKTSTNQQLERVQQSIVIVQEKIGDFEESSSVKKLQNAVSWAEAYPIKTIPFLQHITSLLPERGFIESMAYGQDGSVLLRVRFDSNREIAYYIKSLSDSPLLADVNLLTIETLELEGNLDDILPRSIANLELSINKQALKEQQKETEQ
jgi:type IV pilus assembly protein PilN